MKLRPTALFRPLWSCLAATALLAGAGCASKPAVTPAPVRARPRPSTEKQKELAAPAALRARELGRVPNVTYGPYLGVREDGAMVAWAPIEGKGRRFELVSLSSRGRPLGAAIAAGAAPEALGLVVVRPFGPGYAVVYTAKEGNGEVLRALCTGREVRSPEGKVVVHVGPPMAVRGRALWVEAVSIGSGGVVLYAIQGRDKRAELWATSMNARCEFGAPVLAVKEAEAWQALRLGTTAFIASVQEARAGNTVSATLIDATGAVKKSAVIAADVEADRDLDAVAVGDRAIVAWTNQRPLDPRVETALVDAEGQVLRAPQPLTPPAGEQTLVRLIAPVNGSTTAYAAWERVDTSAEARRRVSVAALAADGRLAGSVAELEYASTDGGSPEFAAASDGLAALTLAPICPRAGTCEVSAPIGPTYVRFDAQMAPVASEPLRLDALDGERAELGFGLGCTKDGCFAISALSRVPAPVFATELEARSNAWRVPAFAANQRTGLRVLEHETVSKADSVAALAVEPVQGKDYLAYVTDFDPTTPWARLKKPAPDGRFEPFRAKVALAALVGSGAPPAPELAISLRAESLAGLALAPSDPSRDEALVAWAGLDAGTPQVFLTLVNKGAKAGQRMLTRKKGDLGDIAAVWVNDGWIVAWIDERSGDAEVYAAKVDTKLNRISNEQRITNAPGTASDLSLAYDGTNVRLVWADARGADRSGHSDIYTALLKVRDASREGDEQRVAETPAHSFAPVLRAARGGFSVAWLERAEGVDDGRVAVSTIDAKGASGPPALLTAGGAPRSLNLWCSADECRIAAISDRKESNGLFAAQWKNGPPSEMTPVMTLSGGAGAQVRPAFRGEDILYIDASSDEARIRRIKLKW